VRNAAPAAAAAGSSSSNDDEALQEQVELLMRKVIALKKSRDKLLAQMDRQSVEMEQMALDNQVRACMLRCRALLHAVCQLLCPCCMRAVPGAWAPDSTRDCCRSGMRTATYVSDPRHAHQLGRVVVSALSHAAEVLCCLLLSHRSSIAQAVLAAAAAVCLSLLLQALAASASQARAEGQQWCSQAQDGLLTISQLQEMLAEGASWEASAAAAADAAATGQDQGHSHSGEGGDPKTTSSSSSSSGGVEPHPQDQSSAGSPAKLRAALLQEQARSTALDVQVRVLSAQLVRAQAAYQAATRSLLPILGGVEARLLALQARSAPRTK
jgi:hypothetical protein